LTSYNLQFRFLHQQQKRHWTLYSDIINILQLLSGGEMTNLGEYSRHMTKIQSAYNTGAICEGRGTKKKTFKSKGTFINVLKQVHELKSQ